jgi:hypothetical protein
VTRSLISGPDLTSNSAGVRTWDARRSPVASGRSLICRLSSCSLHTANRQTAPRSSVCSRNEIERSDKRFALKLTPMRRPDDSRTSHSLSVALLPIPRLAVRFDALARSSGPALELRVTLETGRVWLRVSRTSATGAENRQGGTCDFGPAVCGSGSRHGELWSTPSAIAAAR